MHFLFALLLAFFVVACGDDESSFAPRDDEPTSSSSERVTPQSSSRALVILGGACPELSRRGRGSIQQLRALVILGSGRGSVEQQLCEVFIEREIEF